MKVWSEAACNIAQWWFDGSSATYNSWKPATSGLNGFQKVLVQVKKSQLEKKNIDEQLITIFAEQIELIRIKNAEVHFLHFFVFRFDWFHEEQGIN